MKETNETEHQDKKLAEDGVIWCSSRTNTKSLAACIYGVVTRENVKEIRLRAIGAGAISQMLKSYVIAKSKLAAKGITPTMDVYFKDVKSTEQDATKDITAIEIYVKFL